MAMMIKGGRARGRRRRAAMADINVTPMVDVMLVLLIVFMITAPLLAQGVAVNLPRTKAAQLPAGQQQPLQVTVDKDGSVYIGTQKTPVPLVSLATQLKAIAEQNLEQRVYVRGDAAASFESVMQVLALLQRAGFTNAALPVDANAVKRVDEILEKGAAPEKGQPAQKGTAPQ